MEEFFGRNALGRAGRLHTEIGVDVYADTLAVAMPSGGRGDFIPVGVAGYWQQRT